MPNGGGKVEQSRTISEGLLMKTTETGYLIDGLWDGEVIQKNDPDENYDYTITTYDKGKWIVLGEKWDDGNGFFWYQAEFTAVMLNGDVQRFISVPEPRINDLLGVSGFAQYIE